MTDSTPTITIPVDLTNPGQFFACCGLLELADRLWPGAEGWFEGDALRIEAAGGSLNAAVAALRACTVVNTMTPEQHARLAALSAMSKRQRGAEPGLDDEKKALESLRRELPIALKGPVSFLIDWFADDLAGGSRFKTWAGQQSVLDIAQAMHAGIGDAGIGDADRLWGSVRGVGLPFNFDSDLGGQGSALDIGFSFDPLAGSEITRIEGTCKPALELLAFIGLQRFRPREVPRQNRFVFTAWPVPLPLPVASAVASSTVSLPGETRYEFKLLYRTKYLKSFMPAIPYQQEGERSE